MMQAVFTPVHSTVRAVFPAARAYNQAVYSFMDEWGWNIAFTEGGALLEPAEVDRRIAERIKGTTEFLDGESYRGIFSLSKMHRKTLAEETRILSVAKGTFATMHSQGLCVAEK